MRVRAGSLVLPLTLSLGMAVTSLALLAPVGGAADAAPGGPAYRRHDYADGQARYVLPPGENGLVNATDALAFETTQQRPANSQDQLGQYSGLLYGYPTLTDATLGTYFNDESFGVRPADVTRTETPGDGVTIYRDTHDVPHVYGDTDRSAAFGAGYAQAEDRLFLMDVLRHYGAGTLSGFLGASCEFEQMDHDQLLLAPYTPAQAQRQVDLLPRRYGAQGALAKTMIDSYVDGVNAYIAAARLNPALMPVDYLAGAPDAALPQPWTDADVVSIAGLIGGIFGKGGGAETDDAHLLSYLRGRYGARAGLRAYRDFNHQNDPLAPTTITDRRFPYDVRTESWHRSLNAIPGPKAADRRPGGHLDRLRHELRPAHGLDVAADDAAADRGEHHLVAARDAPAHEQRAGRERVAHAVGPSGRGLRPPGVLLRAADPLGARPARSRLRRDGGVVPRDRPRRARAGSRLRLVGDLGGQRPDRPAGGEDLHAGRWEARRAGHVVRVPGTVRADVPPDLQRERPAQGG